MEDIGKKMKRGDISVKIHSEQWNKIHDIDSDVSDVKEMRQKDL